jgi:trehalose-6-phosphate synthase
VAVTKVYFKLISTKISINTKKFELMLKEKDVKTIVSKVRDHKKKKKKVMGKQFESLVYYPLSN